MTAGKRPSTAQRYADRLERVLQALHADPSAPLDIAALAEIACFSPYHFSRIYRAVLSETPAETQRRLRLQRAAHALIESDAPIETIARAAGYGGAEAFTRAFSAAYGAPPASYRRDTASRARTPDKALNPGPTHNPGGRPVTEDQIDDIQIENRPAATLLALAHRGPYIGIGASFERLGLIAGPAGLFGPATRMVALYYDDPETTTPEALRSHAALTIAADQATAAAARTGLEVLATGAGPHAVLRHVGPYAELAAAYRRLYGAWLPRSGREPADAPPYEVYLNDPRTTAPQALVTEICLPLAA